MALVCIKLEELDEARALIDKGIDAAKQEERFNAKLYLLLMLRYKYFEEAKIINYFWKMRLSRCINLQEIK